MSDSDSAGVTMTGRPLIERHAAASIAMNGPAGIASRATARERATGLNVASHWTTEPAVSATASARVPATQRRPIGASRGAKERSAAAAANAMPNGKNAASEWKYQPRVECRVQSSDCAMKTRISSEDHARTSARPRDRHAATAARGPSRTKKAKNAVAAFDTTALILATRTSGNAPTNCAAVGGATRKNCW